MFRQGHLGLKIFHPGGMCSLKDRLSHQGSKSQRIVSRDHLLVFPKQTVKMLGGDLGGSSFNRIGNREPDLRDVLNHLREGNTSNVVGPVASIIPHAPGRGYCNPSCSTNCYTTSFFCNPGTIGCSYSDGMRTNNLEAYRH